MLAQRALFPAALRDFIDASTRPTAHLKIVRAAPMSLVSQGELR